MTTLGRLALTFMFPLLVSVVFSIMSLESHNDRYADRQRKKVYERVAFVFFWVGASAEVVFGLLKIWGVS
jgi:hypothetical protein